MRFISLGDTGQFERRFILFLSVLLHFSHSTSQNKSLVSCLILRDDVGSNRNVINFVFCDNIELICKFANNLRRGLDCHYHFSNHSHSNLHKKSHTKPI